MPFKSLSASITGGTAGQAGRALLGTGLIGDTILFSPLGRAATLARSQDAAQPRRQRPRFLLIF